MTPTEQAARWLADVPRYGTDPDDCNGFIPTADGAWLDRDEVLAAIARLFEPRDDLVEQAAAALEGVTEGPWRVDGEPWNQIVWSGADNRVCFMSHSNGLNDERDIATARFIAFARNWVPEAAARIAALTATVREMALQELASLGQAQEAYEAQLAAETDNATLRDRLARMEGAIWQKVGECLAGMTYREASQESRARIKRAIDAALTDGGSNG